MVSVTEWGGFPAGEVGEGKPSYRLQTTFVSLARGMVWTKSF